MTSAPKSETASANLDPKDWSEFRALAHRMLDDMVDYVANVRDRPVWQPQPEENRAHFARRLPQGPRELSGVLEDIREHVLPYATGNLHPSFMGWVHGAGTPVGMLAELVSGGLNMNCGGRDHVGIEVEKQIVRWMREALGYPDEANGLFVTGSSMANFLAVTIAKTEILGQVIRETGLQRTQQHLVAYTSREAHGCIAQAMQLSGIGSDNLRMVVTDAAGRMRPDALAAAIAEDRAAGYTPFLVVGTAGTVNTGAIDPLAELADIAAREKLWFHVDGAIGALAMFSPEMRTLFSGIEASHSIALDFHKWGHVPYDAGFLLVRDGAAQKRSFAQPAAYLQRSNRGLAAGETWPCDLGPDLSRGARALKTWLTIEAFGAQGIGQAIAHTCEVARHLAGLVEQQPIFELRAPVALNIVCFGIPGKDDEFIRNLVLDLQETGLAAPSWTTIDGRRVVRCAIVNHRTTKNDMEAFVRLVLDHLTEKEQRSQSSS